VSKESLPVREVVPFKPGKRQSTFRKLNIDFAGTALEEALARQQLQEEKEDKAETTETVTPLTPVTGVRDDPQNERLTSDETASAIAPTPLTPVTAVTPVTPDTGVRAVKDKKKMVPVTGINPDAAPKKDFTRAANSIVRDAIPAGVFTGKGKHLYDYLYSQTRGAIVPVRSARIPTEKVMAGAGMTRNTFRFHLERLCNSGLVKVDQRPGEHGGNVYTVLLPEEAGLQRGDRGHRGERGDTTDTGENLPLVQGSVSDPSNLGINTQGSSIYRDAKTLFKTKEINTDDEAFAKFVAAVKNAVMEITGREPSAAEADRWEELADVLITELKIAAGRTTISSVPTFLAEHLRRRLWKKEKRQIEAEAAEQKRTAPAQKVDASKCPDCFGTGMYYPEGYDKGVAKCPHLKLAEEGSK
jgi:hypothetical protein